MRQIFNPETQDLRCPPSSISESLWEAVVGIRGQRATVGSVLKLEL